VRFEVVTVLFIQSMVLRVVTPCSLLIRSSYIFSSVSTPSRWCDTTSVTHCILVLFLYWDLTIEAFVRYRMSLLSYPGTWQLSRGITAGTGFCATKPPCLATLEKHPVLYKWIKRKVVCTSWSCRWEMSNFPFKFQRSLYFAVIRFISYV